MSKLTSAKRYEELYPKDKVKHPVSEVKWVDLSLVQANDYNPNNVARTELKLLQTSILADGFTQPIVTIFDEKIHKYVVVDGFHRFTCVKINVEINKMCDNKVPIVVIKKKINDRMASTIRHNRARGKHSVVGMSDMVFRMLDNGMGDTDICKELGMEAEELVRLKHLTGFSKLFENVEYRRAWETDKQIRLRKDFKDGNGTEES